MRYSDLPLMSPEQAMKDAGAILRNVSAPLNGSDPEAAFDHITKVIIIAEFGYPFGRWITPDNCIQIWLRAH